MKRILLLLIAALPILGQSTFTLTEGIGDLARQVGEGVKNAKQQRIAVLPLTDLNHAQSDLGTYIVEELSTRLAIQQVDVVERALLDRVLTELKLNETGAIDPETAKKVGKFAGADAIVTGTVTELTTTLHVNCRVIATSTGRVITGALTKITIDADVNILRKHSSAPDVEPEPEPKAKEKPAALSWKYDALRIVIDNRTRLGNRIKLTLAINNTSAQTQHPTIPKYSLVDENGDSYKYDDDSERFARNGVVIPPGTRARSVFAFYCNHSACNGLKVSVVAPDGEVVLSGVPVPPRR